MTRKSESVFDEPQYTSTHFRVDDTDGVIAEETPSADELPVWQGVLDEPIFAGAPENVAAVAGGSYRQWLQEGVQRTPAWKSWGITLGLACVSGCFAVFGAMLTQIGYSGAGGMALAVAAGPLAEEVMKIAAVLMTVEKRPYLFRSPLQIMLCGLASATVFAVLENLLYLHLYIPSPTLEIIRWRWTICSALHIGCTMVASLGVVRIWRAAMAEGRPPRVGDGMRYWVVAAVIHGLYNFAAIMISPAIQGG